MKKILFFILITLSGYIKCSEYNREATLNLIEYSKSGDLKKVQECLKLNPDINGKDDDGDTALILAAYNGHTETVNLLLDCNKIDISLTNYGLTDRYDGKTALEFAQEKSYDHIVKLIEDYEKYKYEYWAYLNNDNHEYDLNIANQTPGLPLEIAGIINGYAQHKLKFSQYLKKKNELAQMEAELKEMNDKGCTLQ